MRDRRCRARYIAVGFIVSVLAFASSQAYGLADDITNSAFPSSDGVNGASFDGPIPPVKTNSVDLQSQADTQELVVAAKKTAMIKIDAGRQTAAVIVIPGALLKPDGPNAKTAKESGGGFFGPVTRLHDEVVRLEVGMSKLTAPIAGLQPEMLGLEKQLSGVMQQTVNFQEQIGDLEGKIVDTTGQMVGIQSDIKSLRIQLGTLIRPVQELKDPVIQLRSPVVDLWKPLVSMETRLAGVDARFAGLDRRFVELDSRFVELDSRFASLDSRFASLDARFATLGSQLERLQVILSGILSSAMSGAVIVAVLLLVGAVLNRRKTSNGLQSAYPPNAKEEKVSKLAPTSWQSNE